MAEPISARDLIAAMLLEAAAKLQAARSYQEAEPDDPRRADIVAHWEASERWLKRWKLRVTAQDELVDD